jgi:hypothetical protein
VNFANEIQSTAVSQQRADINIEGMDKAIRRKVGHAVLKHLDREGWEDRELIPLSVKASINELVRADITHLVYTLGNPAWLDRLTDEQLKVIYDEVVLLALSEMLRRDVIQRPSRAENDQE